MISQVAGTKTIPASTLRLTLRHGGRALKNGGDHTAQPVGGPVDECSDDGGRCVKAGPADRSE